MVARLLLVRSQIGNGCAHHASKLIGLPVSSANAVGRCTPHVAAHLTRGALALLLLKSASGRGECHRLVHLWIPLCSKLTTASAVVQTWQRAAGLTNRMRVVSRVP